MKFKTGALFTFLFLLWGCALHKQSNPSTDLTNTQWTYIDKKWSYEIKFREQGVLATKHPNDITKNNDNWEQNGRTVHFYYNDKFSVYTGQLIGSDTIVGTGKNSNDSWEFKMIRKK